jgi:hypothetical protein
MEGYRYPAEIMVMGEWLNTLAHTMTALIDSPRVCSPEFPT